MPNVASEVRTEELKLQLRKVGSVFLTHREVSAQEAVYRILSIPMKQLSRSVVFVDTNAHNERIAVLKDNSALSQLDDNDTNVFKTSLIDRYQHRPQKLRTMCLAEFAASYVTNYHVDNSDISSSRIALTNGLGQMNKRRRNAVIRFRHYNREVERENWFRAKLMLYYPWYDEDRDLLGGRSTYEEHYEQVRSLVLTTEQRYCQSDVEDIEINENGPPEDLWNDIAPSTEENQAHSREEGSQSLNEISQEDLHVNSNILRSSGSPALLSRFDSTSSNQEIPSGEYRQFLRGLNTEQKRVVMYHRAWCKKAVLSLKCGKPIKPYRIFLSGPGGVGKSHVIRIIQSDTLKIPRLSGALEPDDIVVLLTAPIATGVAAFNIGGMTLHSAFLLGCSKFSTFQSLGADRLNTLRSRLSHLALLIIDEISMVGLTMLLEIHKRLQQIKGVGSDVLFGGILILAVGDLYQLPPVG